MVAPDIDVPRQVEVLVGTSKERKFGATGRAESFCKSRNSCVDQQRYKGSVDKLRHKHFLNQRLIGFSTRVVLLLRDQISKASFENDVDDDNDGFEWVGARALG